MDYKDAWLDLKALLKREDYGIWKSVDHRTSEDDMKMYKGKHDGINIALSFMEEVDGD